jgi:hypothetical protein
VVLCSIDDVRAYINPVSVDALEISHIIQAVTKDVLAKAGTANDSNSYLVQAGIHGSVAATIKLARSKGELAGSVETPESKISNTGLIEEIKQHENDRDEYIQLYINSIRYANFAIPTGRIGYKTVNGE